MRRGQKAAIRRYRNRSDIAQRESPSACLRPVSGLASGPEILKTAPSHAYGTVVLRGLWLAYRCVGSAGFASAEQTRTGFPFQSREIDFLNHLRRQAAYADESGYARDVVRLASVPRRRLSEARIHIFPSLVHLSCRRG